MKKNGEKLFWGMFFILGAVFILVGKMGYLKGISIFSLLLTILLAACLIKSVRHLQFAGMLFSLAFLAIIYDKPLGIEALTPWSVLGAALLGSIGLEILFHGTKKRKKAMHMDMNAEKIIDFEDENCISYSTTFGSGIKYVNSDDFKQMKLDCNFGEMKVYLDNALIQHGSAVVDVKVAFGEIQLFVPKEWQVVNHVSAVFGDVNEKNRAQSQGTPVLRLGGSVSFGSVVVTYI